MTNNQLETILAMTPQDRYKAWAEHCQEVIFGYAKLELRLLSKMNEDLANTLSVVECLNHRLGQDVKEAILGETVRCMTVASNFLVANGVDDEVIDKLLGLIQPEEEQPVTMPDFKPVVASF